MQYNRVQYVIIQCNTIENNTFRGTIKKACLSFRSTGISGVVPKFFPGDVA